MKMIRAAVLAGMMATGAWAAPTVKIAILQDGVSPYFQSMAAEVQQEISLLLADDWDVTFLDGPEWTGDWQPARAGDLLRAALEDPTVDLIYCAGLLLARAAVAYPGPLPKPVISGFIEDSAGLDLPIGPDGYSQITNYSFTTISGRPEDDLDLFRQIVPFQRLAILADGYFLEHIPELRSQAAAYAELHGLEVTLAPLGATADEALSSLPDDAQAVYLAPSVVLDDDEWQALIDGINLRRLPSFSMLGVADVRRGVMAGCRPDDDIRTVRRLALNVQQVLMGTPPEKLPVHVDIPERITLNARTARQVGVALPYRLMLTADVLHPDEMETGRRITLQQAFLQALEDNPAVAGAREETNKAEADRLRARAQLLPQLRGNLQFAQIDKDRAEASLGMQPQRQTYGGLALTQLIFNDPAVTAYRASQPLWQSSLFDLQTRELDVLEDVFHAYINLLSQRALLVIDIDNYHLIQRYLELARSRQRSGMAGPEELYRWEAQLAAARSAMLRSMANMSIAQTQLNQAMGNDAEDLWSPADLEELTEANPCLAPEFSANITDDREFEALTAFLLRQAIDESPELRAVEAAITAQAMVLNQHRRRRFVPEVGGIVLL